MKEPPALCVCVYICTLVFPPSLCTLAPSASLALPQLRVTIRVTATCRDHLVDSQPRRASPWPPLRSGVCPWSSHSDRRNRGCITQLLWAHHLKNSVDCCAVHPSEFPFAESQPAPTHLLCEADPGTSLFHESVALPSVDIKKRHGHLVMPLKREGGRGTAGTCPRTFSLPLAVVLVPV